jgi:hypothetical protein
MQRDALLIDGTQHTHIQIYTHKHTHTPHTQTHSHTHTHTHTHTHANCTFYIVILIQIHLSLPYSFLFFLLSSSLIQSYHIHTILKTLSHIFSLFLFFHVIGEIIYGGDRGAEGVLGALVRHLLDKTEILKNYSLSPDYQCRYVVCTYICDYIVFIISFSPLSSHLTSLSCFFAYFLSSFHICRTPFIPSLACTITKTHIHTHTHTHRQAVAAGEAQALAAAKGSDRRNSNQHVRTHTIIRTYSLSIT